MYFMKYLIALIPFFLCNIAIAENSAQASPALIEYTLNLNFDKTQQKVIIHFYNKSNTDLHIRRDFSPFSLLLGGVSLSAFNDSESLLPVPMYYAMGHDPRVIAIPANALSEEGVELDSFIFKKDYCSILNKNPILILWSYSYYGDDYTLHPKEGVFRIKKSDVKCESK